MEAKFSAKNCASKSSSNTYPWRYENPEKGYPSRCKLTDSESKNFESSRRITGLPRKVVKINFGLKKKKKFSGLPP